ncbi:hypothetical protein [Microvirga puerhi]|uniref:Uncharacterized protein n=1 Tax=Microvirga puerhi TaxID=2876078 RepID=A0ABS7VLG4_9HYPH|nr:hypothetical protein [Microvirga puerhi]MBZ6075915.1 hypothetical protein [Microvirga puerhi]
MTTPAVNPDAPHHLPIFITAPGETDVLLVIMGLFLVLAVLAVGILFLRLHTLPERMAHKSQKIQFEIVAVLGLLALFTHMHIFWVAGLLLALIDIPDFGWPLRRMAGSLEKIAGIPPGQGADDAPDRAPDRTSDGAGDTHSGEASEESKAVAPTRIPKERIHA